MNISFTYYQPAFRAAAVDIFYSNTPVYFDRSDIDSFTFFLDNLADENYLVVLRDDQVIGCGGHYLNREKKIVGLAWVMFKRFSLGAATFKNLSPLFFDELMKRIRKEALPYDIVINTTQLMEANFSNLGFNTEEKITDGFRPGLDHLVMRNKYFSML